MQKRRSASVLVVYAIIICLVAVLGSFTVVSSAKPVEIEHFVSPVWGIVANEAYQRIADTFNKSQDEVRVNIVIATGNFEEKVLTRIAAGAAPDVINSNKFSDLAPQGILQPLTEFAKRDNLIKALLPPAVEAATWDGELLMLPQVAQPFVTYYNPMLFAMAGLSNPYDMHKAGSWTWDAVSVSARRISTDQDADGKLDVWGMGLPVTSQHRAILWVVQAGGMYFDRWVNPTKATYNSPGVARALSFLYDLVQKQAMPLEGATTNQISGRFNIGRAGLMFEGPWQMGTIRNANFTDWDVAPVPRGPANAGTIMQVDGVQMLKASKNPEAAWKWMKYLVSSEEAFTEFTLATARPPAILRGLQTYLKVVVHNGQPAHTDALADAMMNSVVGPCIPIVTNITAINTVYSSEILKYLKNEQSLQSALQKIEESANITLQQARVAAK